MCVLTFIPLENNGFILTSNRDEAVAREAALPPKKYKINGQNIFFPKDPQGGGTWIASCGFFTLCLLNGGLIKHIPNPPYRKSRGKVILDFYDFKDVNLFIENYNFDNIEPFTLIIIENSNYLIINELRWTGKELLHKKIDAHFPQIWSSVTLYSPEIIKERENWFKDFLRELPNSKQILEFHHTAGNGDKKNAIKMNREDKLKTISISQFIVSQTAFTLYYEDLQNNKQYNYRIFLEPANY